jgi:hypothetical protein
MTPTRTLDASVRTPSILFSEAIMNYESHPLADALPTMLRKEYQELSADIQRNGLLESITLFEGKVLDGRHRLRACQELGIEPKFVEYAGTNPAAFVITKNVRRRHLAPGKRAMVVVKISDLVTRLEAEARQRRLDRLKKGQKPPLPSGDGNGDGAADPDRDEVIGTQESEPPQTGNKHANTATARLGELAGVSEKTMERAKYVHDHGTAEDVKEVESGTKTVSQKEKEVRARKKNHRKSRKRNRSRVQQQDHPQTEEELIAAEWTTCLRTLQHTLCLDPNKLPEGEVRDRAARFLQGLEEDLISPQGIQEMEAAVRELRDRCQQMLRRLAAARKASGDRSRPRSQSATTTAGRYRPRNYMADFLGQG